jgi:hypothetical protein
MIKKTSHLFSFIFILNNKTIRLKKKQKKKKLCQSHGISSSTEENLTPILDIIDFAER